jgi:hypothetical protein
MVLGITLSDYEVFFQPDFISTGIPDNWGAAAVVYALVEGLCGVKDLGTGFDNIILAPRWNSAGVDQTLVTIKYPASGGYVRYNYFHSEGKIEIHFTGTSVQTDLRVLLGQDENVSRVEIDGVLVNHNLVKKEDSRYVQYSINEAGTHKVIIYLG